MLCLQGGKQNAFDLLNKESFIILMYKGKSYGCLHSGISCNSDKISQAVKKMKKGICSIVSVRYQLTKALCRQTVTF